MTASEALGRLAELAQSTTDAAPSPCTSVCRMDADSDLCLGCFRTIDEIVAWARQSDRQHRAVWQQIVRRAGLDAAPASQPSHSP